MEKILRGKYLVRRSKLEDGRDAVTITGIFHPQNFNIDEINGDDEMWVSDIIISSGGLRFTDPIGIDGGSPEDFLDGNMTSPTCWKNKSSL